MRLPTIDAEIVWKYLAWTKDRNFKSGAVKVFCKEHGLPVSDAFSVVFSKRVYEITGYTIIEHRNELRRRQKNKEEYIRDHGETRYSNQYWFTPAGCMRNLAMSFRTLCSYY